MATLTGTTIQSTYDSLLKVTDNDSITSSLKRITDGLGNNTPLYLSSSAVEIVSTLNVTSTITGSNLSGTNTGDETKASIETKLGAATSSNSGYLTSADWSTFSNKIAGSGTLNTIPKFSSSSSIGNSNITDNGTTITLGSGTRINGGVGFNVAPSANIGLRISTAMTGGTSAIGLLYDGIVQSDATATNGYIRVASNTAAASFTTTNINLFQAGQGTFGAGSVVTNQNGFIVTSTLIGATNNFGFRGSIPAQTGAWNLYMDGAANNYIAGALGIGSTSLTARNLVIDRTISGSTTGISLLNSSTIASDVTGDGTYFRSISSTQASAFTLTNLYHFRATQATFGAGSVVTNQFGFHVISSLTGATNNYAFYGDLASATGRWNLYMNGTAANYLAGNLNVGSTTDVLASSGLSSMVKIISGTNNGILFQNRANDATAAALYFTKTRSGTGGIYTSGVLSNDVMMFLAGEGSDGVSALRRAGTIAITAEANFSATSSPGRIVFGTTPAASITVSERMRITSNGNVLINDTFDIASNYKVQVTGDIYTSGSIAIGSVSSISTKLLGLGRSITGATTAYGITFEGNIESTVTTNGIVYRSYPIVTGGTLGAITHYIASKNAFIGGSTVTNQYGFFADASVSGATNNYGFYGNIASATGAWNLYMNGTAQNYINGNLGIGVAVPTVKLDVSGAGLFSSSVTASSFIKSGGTSAQLLAGDGSVVTAGTNITISGGTISSSGGLSGSGTTNYVAKFTGSSAIGNSLIFDNGTNVGIGTTSPFYSLDLTGQTIRTARIYSGSSDTRMYLQNTTSGNPTTDAGLMIGLVANDSYFYNYQSGNSIFGTAATERMRITSTGNVGIGTTSPASRLSVWEGEITISNLSSAYTAPMGSIGAYNVNANSGGLVFKTSNSGTNAEKVRITYDGNVGIGTTAPGGLLDINSSTTNDRLIFSHTGSIKSIFGVQTSGVTYLYHATSSSFPIWISAAGNVGIGATSPSYKLDVSGNANITGYALIGSHAYLTSGNYIYFDSGVTNDYSIRKTSSTLAFASAGNFTFNNNVGIGTTSPSAKLQVYSGASVTDYIAVALGDASNSISYVPYVAAGDYNSLSYGGGSLLFNTISSRLTVGTHNGTAIQFGPTNTLISGNVLINTTTDNNSGAKLQVTGNITFQNIFNRRTASYTLALTDQNDIIEMNVGSANNLTVPLNSSVAFPIGTEIAVLQYGSGQTTIVATGGVTLRSKSNALKISGQFAGCTLVKVGTDEWYVVGDLTI